MTFAAIDSALLGPLFATEAMRAVFSDRARLAAMLHTEAALARAEAKAGLVAKGLAPAIERIAADDLDVETLGREIAVSGIPVIPFARAVEARLPENLRGDFHHATTTQDILDTALALQMAEAFALIVRDLEAIMAGLAGLATRYRTTPCAGRTLGQHAAPVTFGYVAALWLAGIAEVAAGLPRVRDRALVVSLSGPVGTLAGLGDKGPEVVAAMAKELGLGAPPVGTHVLRARIVETGAWLAMLIGGARQDGGRRRPAVGDRDRRGRRAAHPGPRRLLGDAAQAQSGVVDRDPRGAGGGEGTRGHPPRRDGGGVSSGRSGCGTASGTRCRSSSASPPARFTRRATSRRAWSSIATACATTSMRRAGCSPPAPRRRCSPRRSDAGARTSSSKAPPTASARPGGRFGEILDDEVATPARAPRQGSGGPRHRAGDRRRGQGG